MAETETSGAVRSSHLDGRVLVVTGAGGGFGKLMVEMASRRGAKVVVADINAEAAEAVANAIAESGGEALAVPTDVTDLGQVRELVGRAVEHFGAVDFMVNNAGIMPLAFIADHADASGAWDRCIDINFKGVLHGISAVYDQMIEQGRGHIVNISSIYGNAGTPGSAVYSATKAAVVVLSDALRKESQGKIKVTVVRPTGVINTGLGSTVVNPEATVGIVGPHQNAFITNVMTYMGGGLSGPKADIDSPEFWAIEPETIAKEVIHALDQPWGVTISDITVRATGEMFTI
ncbi:MAG: SDR family oxidoreductase [Microthrixaceae bacterium]